MRKITILLALFPVVVLAQTKQHAPVVPQFGSSLPTTGYCVSGQLGQSFYLTSGSAGQYVNTSNSGTCSWSGPFGTSSVTYPGAGVANSTGSAWGASYAVGTAANDLVQLNGSGFLPALNASLLTALPLTTGVTGILPSANGGTGINNTATLTLGTSNHNYATLASGIIKNTTTTGALSIAAAGTDYATATNGSNLNILTSNGSGGFGTVIIPATGIATFLATPSSANLLAALTTKTGTGNAMFGTSPTATGLTLGDITGSTQCLHVSSAGLVTGTGSDCGSGGSTAFSAITGSTNTTAAMVLGSGSSLTVSGSGTNNATSLGGSVAALYALLASPALTGIPTAPTATSGTNTTQLATTAFVQAAISGPSGIDILPVTTTSTVLTVGANCSNTIPCNVNVGNTIYAFTAPITATISTGSDTAYIYVTSAGVIDVATASVTPTCSGCTAVTGSSFPTNSTPIALATFTSGVWTTTPTDERAFLGRDLISAGTGLSSSFASGIQTLSVTAAPLNVTCGGTNASANTTLISAVLAVANSYNLLPACTIAITNVTSTAAGVTLDGPGATLSIATGTTGIGVAASGNNFTAKNLSITGNNINAVTALLECTGVTNCAVSNVNLATAGTGGTSNFAGGFVSNNSTSTVSGGQITNIAGYCAQATGTGSLTITAVFISVCDKDGAVLQTGATANLIVNASTIQYIDDTGAGSSGAYGNGIYCGGGAIGTCSAANNKFFNTKYSGIRYANNGGTADTNSFTNTGDWALYCELGCSYTTFTGNTIIDPFGGGIDIANGSDSHLGWSSTISGNTVKNCGGSSDHGASTPIFGIGIYEEKFVTVTGNTVDGCYYGGEPGGQGTTVDTGAGSQWSSNSFTDSRVFTATLSGAYTGTINVGDTLIVGSTLATATKIMSVAAVVSTTQINVRMTKGRLASADVLADVNQTGAGTVSGTPIGPNWNHLTVGGISGGAFSLGDIVTAGTGATQAQGILSCIPTDTGCGAGTYVALLQTNASSLNVLFPTSGTITDVTSGATGTISANTTTDISQQLGLKPNSNDTTAGDISLVNNNILSFVTAAYGTTGAGTTIGPIQLTTTGTSGAATLSTTTNPPTLNIPQYSGGGGTGNAAATHAPTTGTSMAFTATSASAGTVDVFVPTAALGANVATSTCSGFTPGQKAVFIFTQDGTGGRTVAACSGWDAFSVAAKNGVTTTLSFTIDASGNGHQDNGNTDTPFLLAQAPTRAAPTISLSCSTAFGCFWFDSTSEAPTFAVNANTTKFVAPAIVASATSHNWVQYISANGTQNLAQPGIGDLSAQAADTVDMNATGGSASPTAVAMPTCTTGADLYNTSSHSWSCVSTGGGSGTGFSVVPKTSGYTFVSGDGGQEFTFNGSSLTATLTSSPPTMPWAVGIKNLNASALTIARNSNTINGGTSNITLQQYQSVTCASDTVTGSNYVCDVPDVAGTNVTLTPAPNGITVAASGSGSGNATYCSGSASATAATCTGTPAPTTYTGLTGSFAAGATSTGAPLTVNINSLGAKSIYLNGTATSATNFVISGQVYSFTYDGTEIQLSQPSSFPSSVSIGTAPACTAGTSGAWCTTEGTAFTNVSGAAGMYPDSTAHEFLAKTNGSASAGMMERVQPGAIHQTAQTAAISTATLCASSAGACNTAGQYHVHWDFIQTGTACSLTGATAGSTFLLTWTDTNGTSHSAVSALMQSEATGAGTPLMTQTFFFQAALGSAYASGDMNISTNGSVIQYATGYTACTTGTGTYQLDAAVTRLQ